MMNVGDIAYIRISTRGNGSKALVPIKVTEKLIRESIEGKIVSYVVRGPTGEDYEIDPEQEEIFTTLDEAREVVTKEAMAYVDRVIGKAKSFEQKYFAKDIALHNVRPLVEDDERNPITA
jgi:hypothetical protein